MHIINTAGTAPYFSDMWVDERYLYGSERLATVMGRNVVAAGIVMYPAWDKVYELHDHLGNVRATFNWWHPMVIPPTIPVAYTSSYHHMYAFGAPQPNRYYESLSTYHWGFNGKSRMDDLRGVGNSFNFGSRDYDSRIGRFSSVDIKANKFPEQSPYCYAFNNPIGFIDRKGEDGVMAIKHNADGNGGTIIIAATYFMVETANEKGAFSSAQISSAKKMVKELNSGNYKIHKDVSYNNKSLKGYEVKFAITIVAVKSEKNLPSLDGTRLENTIAAKKENGVTEMLAPNNIVRNNTAKEFGKIHSIKEYAKAHGLSTKELAGITSTSRNFIAKQEGVEQDGGSFEATLLHEIFHTLGFDFDNNPTGVGRGTTTKPEVANEEQRKDPNYRDDIENVVKGFIDFIKNVKENVIEIVEIPRAEGE